MHEIEDKEDFVHENKDIFSHTFSIWKLSRLPNKSVEYICYALTLIFFAMVLSTVRFNVSKNINSLKCFVNEMVKKCIWYTKNVLK